MDGPGSSQPYLVSQGTSPQRTTDETPSVPSEAFHRLEIFNMTAQLLQCGVERFRCRAVCQEAGGEVVAPRLKLVQHVHRRLFCTASAHRSGRLRRSAVRRYRTTTGFVGAAAAAVVPCAAPLCGRPRK